MSVQNLVSTSYVCCCTAAQRSCRCKTSYNVLLLVLPLLYRYYQRIYITFSWFPDNFHTRFCEINICKFIFVLNKLKSIDMRHSLYVYCGQSLSSVKRGNVPLSFFVTERLFDVFDWTLMQCQCHLFSWVLLLPFHRYSLAESYLRLVHVLQLF